MAKVNFTFREASATVDTDGTIRVTMQVGDGFISTIVRMQEELSFNPYPPVAIDFPDRETHIPKVERFGI